MKQEIINIPKEKFAFAQDRNLADKKLATKPIGYFKDAMIRFKKNKASIVAAIIIFFLLAFALFAPIFSGYTPAYNDVNFKDVLPRNELLANNNIGFWDGTKETEQREEIFYVYQAMAQETGKNPIKNNEYTSYLKTNSFSKKETLWYKFKVDTLYLTGVRKITIQPDEYKLLQQYQDEKKVQVILPIVDTNKQPRPEFQMVDGDNYWFATDGTKSAPILNEDGTFKNIYKPYVGINKNGVLNDGYTSTMRIEGDTPKYEYALFSGNAWQLRVDYYEYYVFYHSYLHKDGITTPNFLFGTNSSGKDLFACLAYGARFSFILAIVVASFNLIVGAIYGAIEGYYGGKIDLVMERIVDVLGAIPFMVVISLLKHNLQVSDLVIIFISFFLTGWIGMAARTRMQFYRFKNQEYVLVARTLGAKDGRIMFKHIFPNAIGTLITGSVLVIPSVIFSETTLSYLGIINLDTGNLTSIGTMLSKGQETLYQTPHVIIFPAIFISLLMLSFNLFGNGLRDAFNPSLRGTEE